MDVEKEIARIKKIMQEIASGNNIPEEAENTWRHSGKVWELAETIADAAIKNRHKVDKELLHIACFAHDIGRMITGSRGTKELLHPVYHGHLGSEILKKNGMEEYAGFARVHMGGGTLRKETLDEWNIPKEDYAPKTIEEKILAYADARTGFNKNKGQNVTISFEKAYKRFSKFGRQSGRKMKELQRYIQNITAGEIA